MFKDWWNSSDKQELHYLILSALAMFLVLGYFRWHGVEKLRTWSEAGDPPFLASGFVGRGRNFVKIDAGRRSDRIPLQRDR